MHKFNLLSSILLVILIPLTIIVLTDNITLRMPDMYQYHFNDSEVLDEIDYYFPGTQMSSEIASYFSSFSNDKFQVYENNGIYQDPVFPHTDRLFMEKVKYILNFALGVGLLCLIAMVAIYIYLYKNGYKKALRNRCKVSFALTVALFILQGILISRKSIRLWIYTDIIGLKLSESTVIGVILGGQFYSTYLLFSAIIGAVLTGIMFYTSFRLTRPPRIFY